jgi:hypothetical protein
VIQRKRTEALSIIRIARTELLEVRVPQDIEK